MDKTFNLQYTNYYRLALFVAFYVVLQMVIIFQKPFIQIDLVKNIYLAMGIQAIAFFVNFFYLKKEKVAFYILDISLLGYLFYQHSQFSSFYLTCWALLLFISGLALKFQWTIFLGFFSSVLLSLINLKSIQWVGTQNIINVLLFNITFGFVIFIAYQFKSEILGLRISLDISQIKLKSKTDLSDLLIQKMPIGLVATDSQNQFVFSNQILLDVYGLNESSVSEILDYRKQNRGAQVKFYNSQLSETRFYELDMAEYFDEEYKENIKLHLIKDVTEAVRIQEELKQKEKMAAVGQLAAGIAHEIRNPLAGISGSIELLSRENSNPDDQKLMKIIIKEIDRLNNLITDFLSYSRPEKTPDEKVDLANVLEEVLQNTRLAFSEEVGLNIIAQIKSAVVYGFSDKLKQAFINIIFNAIQSMKDSTEKTLTVEVTDLDKKVVVKIRDTGAGMKDEVKKRIFEPFFTTKSKGTGLGMAITHKILDTHMTTVEVDSEVDQGTEFRIYFNKA